MHLGKKVVKSTKGAFIGRKEDGSAMKLGNKHVNTHHILHSPYGSIPVDKNDPLFKRDQLAFGIVHKTPNPLERRHKAHG